MGRMDGVGLKTQMGGYGMEGAQVPRCGPLRGLLWTLLVISALIAAAAGTEAFSKDGSENNSPSGTILFSTVGRAHFSWDLFTVALPDSWLTASSHSFETLQEKKLTDGSSVNYNGHLVGPEETRVVLDRLREEGFNVAGEHNVLLYVSERSGSSRLHFTLFINSQTPGEVSQIALGSSRDDSSSTWRRQMNEIDFTTAAGSSSLTLEVPLNFGSDGPFLFDRPSMAGNRIIYVSTAEPVDAPRQSWAAVYATDFKTRITTRLTPKGVADFSPSVSPSGEWVAAASSEKNGYQGEVRELLTSLVAYRAEDGSGRVELVKQGGWPSWADDRTIYFHRQADDGWWSVYRISLPEKFLSSGGEGAVLQEERITPPGVHAFTPAPSRVGKWIAVATRRSSIRHVEIYDLVTQSFVKLTENITPNVHHYNPFVSDSGSVGYHRCRGNPDGTARVPRLQHVRSPFPGLSIVRADGMFPSLSPDGSQLVVSRDTGDDIIRPGEDTSGLYLSYANGTGQRKIHSGSAFGMGWDRKREGVLYASIGPIFQVNKPVQIISLHNLHGGGEITWKQLTKSGADNNGFPSPSPDGKYLVFRSARSGHKNLYIMDAVDGEEKELRRLTNGPWLDQHPNWSPTGEWIAFVSNRENPNVGSFGKVAIYLIRPDGTGLRKVVESDDAGLTVHPIFSPDGKKLVFASDLAGVSAEPVAEPHQFQPYGEIFITDIDGSNRHRLTHNFIEDGTASWSSTVLSPEEFTSEGQILQCNFEDTRWLGSESYHGSRCPLRRLPPVKC